MTPSVRIRSTADTTDSAVAALLETVRATAAELHPRRHERRAVTLDSALERDLGLDSLARAEVLARLERLFDVELPEDTFAESETPRDLLRAVRSAGLRQTTRVAATRGFEVGGLGETTPREAGTLSEIVAWHLRTHPDRTHVRWLDPLDDPSDLTYRRLVDAAREVGAGLQDGGLETGDRVVLMLPGDRRYLQAFLGTMLAGGVPVPVYPPVRSSGFEDHLRRHRAILDSCAPTRLITVPEARRKARILHALTGTPTTVTTVEALRNRGGRLAPHAISPQDLAFLQYTSGSTGHPKGVMVSHENVLANLRAMGDAIRASPDDVFVSWLPLYHDMGLIGAWLGSLVYGYRLVLMSPLDFLAHPPRWLQAIHRHRATLSAGPNFAFELCLRRIEDRDVEGVDLGSLRLLFNGAEPVRAESVRRFCERFAGHGLRPGAMMPVYGLAEATLGVTFPPPGRGPVIDRVVRETLTRTGRARAAAENDTDTQSFVGCGGPLEGHAIRIVDAVNHELPERHEGRVQFRGPSSTRGYFRNPEATVALRSGDWLDSGDLGYVAGGELFITGRAKDVVIRAGRNIYPQEVEAAVGEVPRVRTGRVAAFGCADRVSGTERLVVVAETRESDRAAREALRGAIRDAASDLSGGPPDDVVLAAPGTLLKTSSGKLRRAAVREKYERGRLGSSRWAVALVASRIGAGAAATAVRRGLGFLADRATALWLWTASLSLAMVAGVLVAVLPTWPRRWEAIRGTALAICRVTGTTLEVRGPRRSPSPGRSCIYVSNHASYVDVVILAATLPREVGFVAKEGLARHWWTRIPFSRIHVEFVERFDPSRGVEDVRRLSRAAEDGRTLVFFPEGTFTRAAGVRPFHMGAFLAAATAGVPVVPVAIRGTRSILRAGTWIARPGDVTVTIGDPIDPLDLGDDHPPDPWRAALRLRDSARRHIVGHAGEPDVAA